MLEMGVGENGEYEEIMGTGGMMQCLMLDKTMSSFVVLIIITEYQSIAFFYSCIHPDGPIRVSFASLRTDKFRGFLDCTQ